MGEITHARLGCPNCLNRAKFHFALFYHFFTCLTVPSNDEKIQIRQPTRKKKHTQNDNFGDCFKVSARDG